MGRKRIRLLSSVLALTLLAGCAGQGGEKIAETPEMSVETAVSETPEPVSEWIEPVVIDVTAAETAREAYAAVLRKVLQEHVTPAGEPALPKLEQDGEMKGSFIVLDVDGDQQEELEISIWFGEERPKSYLLKWNQATGCVQLQLQSGHEIKYYDNGFVKCDWPEGKTISGEQGYDIYRYDPEMERYQKLYCVYGRYAQSKPYPYEIDVSNRGEVYYIDKPGETLYESTPVDIADYIVWENAILGGAEQLRVTTMSSWALSEDEIQRMTEEKPLQIPTGTSNREAFSLILERLRTERIFLYEWKMEYWAVTSETWPYDMEQENQFAVYDVDNDGREELILYHWHTITAGNRVYILDWRSEEGILSIQYEGYPSVTFYKNGAMTERWSHNQTNCTFWPYFLYRYVPETDSYEEVGSVYGIDTSIPCNRSLSEIDVSGTGIVYCIESPSSKEKEYMDESDHLAWRDCCTEGSEEVPLTFEYLTEDNIRQMAAQES